MSDKNIILVEDILDTGLTIQFLRRLFLNRAPRSLKIAALLDKKCRRSAPVDGDYVGFVIPGRIRRWLRPRLQRTLPQLAGRLHTAA